ncbi:phosphatase PAP2 family protein [Streptomyces sp. NPDC018031]|uniref:phosphatase PAP2 family protein n=1 Tax=Streptomyces sp. NPDC018031 TaxID=3365033 RepID=UPI00379EDC6D
MAADGPLRALDERVGRAARGRLVPGRFAEFFADLGNMTVALPVLAVALGYAAWRLRRATGRWWPAPLAAAVTMAAVPALVAPVKALLDRPAPPGPLAGTDGFYPSGHTATATIAYGAAAMLVLLSHRATGARRASPRGSGGAGGASAAGRGGPGRRGVAVVVAAVVLLNLGVGAGLVLRGYHWPLDVIGSWCLSGALLTALLAVCRRWLVPRG